MSQRTLVELNHDFCPPNDIDALAVWARKIRRYMASGDKAELPYGVTYIHSHHHADPDPMQGRGDPS